MIEELIDAQWNATFLTSLPRQRFFVPKDNFWVKLKKLEPLFDMIIDCGTGNGELPKEAASRKIRMAGIDIVRRENNAPTEVQIIPAHRMPFSERMWALVCRPSHGPWCEHLFSKVRLTDAGFIYVGLPNNIMADLDMDNSEPPTEIIKDVGAEGESMLIWMPQR